MDINSFVISENNTYLSALKKIDSNKKGFLVVVNDENQAVGVLTDGDIRRLFISGKTVNDVIKADINKKFCYLNVNEKFKETIDIFKNEAIDFLPVLDENKKIVNIITKKQMHSVLLNDQNIDLKYNFFQINESLIDYEIFNRPWGFYKTTIMNDYFQSKIISILPGGSLSLQSHKHREEHWIIAHGKGTVQLENSIFSVQAGTNIFVPKGCKHRLTNDSQNDNLIIIEVQIGDYFGEDDIKRYEDSYGRV